MSLDLDAIWADLKFPDDHEWLECDECSERQLLAPEKAGRLCHLTVGCDGRVRRVPV